MKETETAKQLRDRTTLRYMGNCKCGKCQLVPRELLGNAANEIDTLSEAARSLMLYADECALVLKQNGYPAKAQSLDARVSAVARALGLP